MLALVLIVLIMATSTYYHLQDKIVAEMVANGEDPIAASCAMSDTLGHHPTCVVYIVGVSK
jgi:hypothetical protein